MTYEFWVTAALFTAAVLFLAIDVPATSRTSRNSLNANQWRFRQCYAKRTAAAQLAAIAIERQRLFEIYQEESEARHDKTDTERDAGGCRLARTVLGSEDDISLMK